MRSSPLYGSDGLNLMTVLGKMDWTRGKHSTREFRSLPGLLVEDFFPNAARIVEG